MIYGYTRVSTRKQVDGYGLEAQRQEILSKYPNAYIFEEQYTGSKMERPIFTKLINILSTALFNIIFGKFIYFESPNF